MFDRHDEYDPAPIRSITLRCDATKRIAPIRSAKVVSLSNTYEICQFKVETGDLIAFDCQSNNVYKALVIAIRG